MLIATQISRRNVMSDAPRPEAHRRPHTAALENTFMELDLPAEIDRLKAETIWSSGHNARTLVKYDDLRVVLIILQTNARMSEHKSGGRISIHALTGHIQVTGAGRTFRLRAGGLLTLDRGVPHDVEAFEESAFLLTIAWPGTP
jgi:quercetin dioxygenase-like cupin family protein